MEHYNYQDTFKKLYDKSVELYRSGNTDKNSWFDSDELAFIAANGWRVQDFFDYGEDQVHGGVPSYEIAQSIEQARRDYFLHVQKSVSSTNVIEASSLPPKPEAVEGIEWLPRIIQKAIGKLKGELCEEIMYCCGGDRNFLTTHDIHPAEFLRLVWANMDNHQAIVDFVKARSPLVNA
ncbi:DUF5069 domain-containing protein [Pelagicoccus albus]|uniref:DUF5069 domain-containing protein n=1 Tax=Pelagicoccus albus TaxID=415222 RepID=A0A7X1B339_9BACT|nr:DUF5069 domain-containing protein [Pelagicoccus albus]MBC2604637.1 DUF5069 domain-containing protein [Pelagicoccus albus]